MKERSKPSREGRWRWVFWTLGAVLVLAAGAALVFLPALIPQDVLRRQVEASLSEAVGQRVTVESARLGWASGLVCRNVTVAADAPAAAPPAAEAGEARQVAPDSPVLARVGKLIARLSPLDILASAAGAGVAPDLVRLENVDLWLVQDRKGRWNVETIAARQGASGQPAEAFQQPRTVEVTRATVHVRNEALGRDLVLARVHGSLGELASTGQGYLSATADLPPPSGDPRDPAGRITVTASVSSMDRRDWDRLGGSLKAEWHEVSWPEALAGVTTVPPLVRAVGRTSGHMSATFDRGAWQADGSVEADLPTSQEPQTPPGPAQPGRAVIGFQVGRAGPGKPIDLALLRLTTPGVTLQATGCVHHEKSGQVRPDLRVEGVLAWGPLGQSVEPVRRFAARFDRFGGETALDLRLTGDAKAWYAAGTLDLTSTVAVRQGAVAKEPAQPGRLDFEATLSHDRTLATVQRLDLTTRAGRLGLTARIPLQKSGAPALESASATLRADLVRTEALLELAPALARGLGGMTLAGPIKADLALAPARQAEIPNPQSPIPNPQSADPAVHRPPWLYDAALWANLTDLDLAIPGGPRKPPKMRAEVRAEGRIAVLLRGIGGAAAAALKDQAGAPPPTGERAGAPEDPAVAWSADLRTLQMALDRATAAWSGTAAFGQNPGNGHGGVEGRLNGRLTVETIESLAALAAPKRVAAGSPEAAGALPLAGDVTAAIQGNLQGGELKGRAELGLTRMSLRLAGAEPPPGPLETTREAGSPPAGRAPAPYFLKPAGRTASAVVEGRCVFGGGAADKPAPNFLDARWTVVLPGLKAEATSQVQFTAALMRRESPTPGRAIVVQAGPMVNLKVEAVAEDVEQALGLSPAAAAHLADRVRGAGSVQVQVFTVPGKISVKAEADLTASALDLGAALTKPRQTPLHLSASAEAASAASPGDEAGLVCQTRLRAQLGDSSADVSGQVGIAAPPSIGVLSAQRPLDYALTLVRSADLQVDAAWENGPALEGLVPALRPLYRQCQVEGPTRLKARLRGTPQAAAIRVDLEGTQCRIRQGTAGSGVWGMGSRGRRAEGGAVPQTPDPRPQIPPSETVFKQAGTPANLALEARWGQVPGELILDRLTLVLADLKAEAAGRLLFDDPRPARPSLPTAWTLRVKGSMPDLAALNAGLPADLRLVDPAGSVRFDVGAAGDALGVGLERCDLALDGVGLKWLGRPMRLDGPVEFDGDRLRLGGAEAAVPSGDRKVAGAPPAAPAPAVPGLRIVAGESDVTVAGEIADLDRSPRGSLQVRGPKVSVDEVRTLIEETTQRIRSLAAPPTARRPLDPIPQTPDPAVPGTASAGLARRVKRLLGRAQLAADVRLGLLTLTVPAWEATYDLTEVAAQARLAEGRFALPSLACRGNNGEVAAEMAIDFRSDPPILSVAYEARNLEARENLKPLIELTFPALECQGHVTQRESKIVPLGGTGHAVGRGETVLLDGNLKGQAAPDYMLRLFPGLKLTTYHYNKMSNEFELQEDGTVQNRMIFDGKSYDIFIFGQTSADGTIRYTLGVDLSVSLGSQVWSRTLDQGKVPLMVYTGRIVGKKFAELDIRYTAPHELAYDVFVKRNLVVKLLTSLGEKPPDLSKPPALPQE